MEERLHTLEAVQERLSVSRSSLYELLAAGQIRSVKIGRNRRIKESDLNEYIGRLQQSA